MKTTAQVRAEYLAEKSALLAKIKKLDDKLEVLGDLEGDMAEGPKENMRRVFAEDLGVQMPSQLTAACEWVVSKYGKDTALSTADVRKHLAAHGYTQDSKHYSVTLMKTLKRLTKDRIKGEKIGPNWSFRSL